MPFIYFKSVYNKNYEQVEIEKEAMSVLELKRQIIEKSKFSNKQLNFDLELINQETNKVYMNENELVNKDTKLMIKRVVAVRPVLKEASLTPPRSSSADSLEAKKIPSSNKNEITVSKIVHDSLAPLNLPSKPLEYKQNSASLENLVTSDEVRQSEKAKLDAILLASSQQNETQPSRASLTYSTSLYRKSIKCESVVKRGDVKLKYPSGIPRTKLREAKPEDKFAMLGPGGYVVPEIEYQAAQVVKKEKPLFLTESEEEEWLKRHKETTKSIIDEDYESEQFKKIPEHLKCPFGEHIIKDAVLIPCCGRFICCDDCIKSKISMDEIVECPYENCDQEIGSLDSVTPHFQLRSQVEDYLRNLDLEKQRKKEQAKKSDVFLDLLISEVNDIESGQSELKTESPLSIYDEASFSPPLSHSPSISPALNIGAISIKETPQLIRPQPPQQQQQQQIPVFTPNLRLPFQYQPRQFFRPTFTPPYSNFQYIPPLINQPPLIPQPPFQQNFPAFNYPARFPLNQQFQMNQFQYGQGLVNTRFEDSYRTRTDEGRREREHRRRVSRSPSRSRSSSRRHKRARRSKSRRRHSRRRRSRSKHRRSTHVHKSSRESEMRSR